MSKRLNDEVSAAFKAKLAQATGGRRYCFVAMTYHDGDRLFKRIERVVSDSVGLECIRADTVPAAGENARDKIHYLINHATIVIGDISGGRPNVYYEIGYALAIRRPALILARKGVRPHFDLEGLEVVHYQTRSKKDLKKFDLDLRSQLKSSTIHVSLLHAMLIPNSPKPSYLLANPKPAPGDVTTKPLGAVRRTYGDYLGVLGIFRAFGCVFGEQTVPELLNPDAVPDSFAGRDANLYCIASPKSNKLTWQLLRRLQKGRLPNWRFEPDLQAAMAEGRRSETADWRDYQEVLLGTVTEQVKGKAEKKKVASTRSKGMALRDYGLIVRGPHPDHPGRLVTIMAGARSLGTGAACLVATESRYIKQVARKLGGLEKLAAQDRSLWVLVEAKTDRHRNIDLKSVKVVKAGFYR